MGKKQRRTGAGAVEKEVKCRQRMPQSLLRSLICTQTPPTAAGGLCSDVL